MAEQWEADYDQRQYALMEDHLRQYEEGRIDLGSLIAGLEALLQCLETADDEWENEFRRYWGVLEEVYAVALFLVEQDRSRKAEAIIKEVDNQRLIQKAIGNIRSLLAGWKEKGEKKRGRDS